MMRRLTRAIHALDHAAGRALGTRHILVELRTPVYCAVLGPVYEQLRSLPDVELWFTSENPEALRPLVQGDWFLTHGQAEWRRFDLYM